MKTRAASLSSTENDLPFAHTPTSLKEVSAAIRSAPLPGEGRGVARYLSTLGRWPNLLESAEKQLSAADDALKSLREGVGGLSDAHSDLQSEGAVGQRDTLASSPDWLRVKSAVVDQLRNAGKYTTKVGAQIDQIGETSLAGVRKEVSAQYQAAEQRFLGRGEALQGIRSTAGITQWVSQFNIDASRGEVRAPSMSALAKWTESAQQSHLSFVSDLHTALGNSAAADAEAVCVDRGRVATRTLTELRSRAVAVHLARDKAASDALDHAAVELGDIARDLWLDLAVVDLVSFLAAIPWATGGLAQWQSAARKYEELGSDRPASMPLPLSHVSKSKASTELVEVAGRITKIVVKHYGGHAQSYAEITDDSGASCIVAANYAKLDTGGPAVGGAVRVVGHVQLETEWLPVNPSVQISTSNNDPAATHTWSSWLLTRMRASYVPYPNNLTIYPSLRPGALGAINPVAFGMSRDVALSRSRGAMKRNAV